METGGETIEEDEVDAGGDGDMEDNEDTSYMLLRFNGGELVAFGSSSYSSSAHSLLFTLFELAFAFAQPFTMLFEFSTMLLVALLFASGLCSETICSEFSMSSSFSAPLSTLELLELLELKC